MNDKVLRLACCMWLATLAGCSALAPLLPQPTTVSVPQATSTPQPTPSITLTTPVTTRARLLHVWLPPRFDPNANTPAARVFKQRLVRFEAMHPGLKIDIRLKAEEGQAGLLNALTLTSLAAPTAMPDLVALARPELEAAVLKGLLHPIDGLSTMLHDPDWYGYARDIGRIQNIGYGLPFAGETLVLVHRADLEFKTWDDILAGKQLLLLPAGDPQAMVMLWLYASAGGKLVDDQGQPTLEEAPLTQALTLIQNGLQETVFLPSLLNVKTDEQAMQAYRDQRANSVITWSGNYTSADGVRRPIPTLNGSPLIFANAWLWALAGSTPENQQIATELAEDLMDKSFLDAWARANGYFPTRISSNADENLFLESAQMIPGNDVVATLGPILNQALSRVLNGEQVQVVVQSALEQLK